MQEIKESLHELYAFVACEDPLGLARPLQLDVLLYAAKDTMKAELSNFKTCLLANPKLPILLFNERNDTNCFDLSQNSFFEKHTFFCFLSKK